MATEMSVPPTNLDKKDGIANSGLIESDYYKLHYHMKKQLPKPKLCQLCFEIAPYDLANSGGYDYDPTHRIWCCRPCHVKMDFENGTREKFFGDKHPSFGSKRTPESIQKMCENHVGFFGKHHSPESLERMRLTKVGYRNPFFRKYHTSETKLMMTLAKSNRKAVNLRSMNGTFSSRLGDRRW